MGFEFQPSDLMMLISVSLMILAVRLLRIASQTRGMPELMMGLYLLLSPPCTSLLMRVDRFAPEYQRMLEIVATTGIGISSLFLCIFAWRVFRPNSTWARIPVVLYSAQFLWSFFMVSTGAIEVDDPTRAITGRVTILLVYCWVFTECLLHHRMLARRLHLGLADPVVVNRFLLFAVWSGLLGVLPGITLLLAFVMNAGGTADQMSSPLFTSVVRLTGILMYVSIWLSFLPPRAYTDWLKRRHVASGVEA